MGKLSFFFSGLHLRKKNMGEQRLQRKEQLRSMELSIFRIWAAKKLDFFCIVRILTKHVALYKGRNQRMSATVITLVSDYCLYFFVCFSVFRCISSIVFLQITDLPQHKTT